MCRAFGRHAGSALIVGGAEIITYFACARAGLSNQPGSLWLYDEAHVIELGQGYNIPMEMQLMELRV